MKARLLLIAAASAAIFSCAKQEADIPQETSGAYEYTFTLGTDVKAAFDGDHIAWTQGDQVGWFAGSSLEEGHSSIDLSTTPRSFKISLDSPLSAGEKFYAYAPFASAGKSAGALKMSIPASQDGASAMPMVAVPVTLAENIASGSAASAGEVCFMNLGSVVLFDIYTTNSAYAGETVTGVRFDASGAIAGEGTIDLTKVDPAKPASLVLSGLTGKSVTAAASGKAGSQASPLKVYMVVAPGTFSGTVTVLTDKASYAYTLGQTVFARNGLKPYKVDLASPNAVRTTEGGDTGIEDLLTAHAWVLKGVKEAGVSVKTSTGNKLTLNSDYSLSFDCSANGGKTFDHTWEGGLIAPDAYGEVSAMSWSVSASGGKDYLNVSNGFLLVYAQEDPADLNGEYEIVELTENKLTVTISSWDEDWTLLFEAEGSASETSVEELLTAHEWALTGVAALWDEDGPYDETQVDTEGNKISFNADYSLSFDCSANKGYSRNYTDDSSFVPSNVGSMSWSLSSDGTQLLFPDGSYPLVILGEGETVFDIVSLDESHLVLSIILWEVPYYLYFAVPEATGQAEELLTAHEWVLTGVAALWDEGGPYDETQIDTEGNKITFNANYTLSFDCSANKGYSRNYTDDSSFVPANVGSMSWSLSTDGTQLVFPEGSYPVVIMGEGETAFDIVTLDSSHLVLSIILWEVPYYLYFTDTPD